MNTVDTIFASLAKRGTGGRTEADIQSDIKVLLLAADLELADDDLDVKLEARSGTGRIDIEIGYTVIETKKDLRKSNVLESAIEQLAGYVNQRANATGARYVGILTDGHDWYLYTLTDRGSLKQASSVTLRDVDSGAGLLSWLSTILATTHDVPATPAEIDRRFGANSPAHDLDMIALRDLWAANAQDTELQLKKELWGKLLHTAFGEQFDDGLEMFIRHTYLVITAELIAHEVLGLDISLVPATDLVTGKAFRDAGVYGVVESDFFDWPAEVEGGAKIVQAIARRVSQIEWDEIEHDLLKHLYESVINVEQRHALGEYYTPDWLAEAVTQEVVDHPVSQRVADFSCGSGTFLFHAVRRVLEAIESNGLDNRQALAHITAHVVGVDVHPVAVTLARVTYLLALGPQRLNGERDALSVPVYLGDSIQWQVISSVLTQDGITIPTEDGKGLFATELFFPASTMVDPNVFEELVERMVSKATSRVRGARPLPKIRPLIKGISVSSQDESDLQQTLDMLCDLHDHHRNHIWGYYVRNLARPRWLTQPEGKVDRIVGNPPWLSYRFMGKDMQEKFRERCLKRDIWAGANVATQQDLSAYFVVRACELYLKPGGQFGLVMPAATLDRKATAGFRSGRWGVSGVAQFDPAWDMEAVNPAIFPVPSSAVFGTFQAHQAHQTARPIPPSVITFQGTLQATDWAQASMELEKSTRDLPRWTEPQSPYHQDFIQGAVIVPRVLHCVEEVAASSALGLPTGMVNVKSARTSQEKKPWRDLPSRGPVPVEEACLRPMHLGSTLLPFRMLEPWQVVLPIHPETGELLESGSAKLEQYPKTAQWWSESSALWDEHGKGRMTLNEQVNYYGKLEAQFPAPALRLVYTKAGTRLAAAIVSDTNAVIDHKLYWAKVSTFAEGRFLEAILNSQVAQTLVQPLQSKGNFGARDFDMYPWYLPIPRFDSTDEAHLALVALADRAAQIASEVDLGRHGFQKARGVVRDALLDSGVGESIEEGVAELLGA